MDSASTQERLLAELRLDRTGASAEEMDRMRHAVLHGTVYGTGPTRRPGHGVRRPSHGIRHPSRGIRHPSRGIRHPSHGIRHPSHGIRRTAAVGGVATAAALAVAGAVVLGGGGPDQHPVAADPGRRSSPTGPSSSAPAPVRPVDAPMLLRNASVAAGRDTTVARGGQFIYTETVTADTYNGHRHNRTRAQVWESADGREPGWIVSVDKLGHPYSQALGGNDRPSLWTPTYQFLTTLPTDPAALLAMIRAEVGEAAGGKPGGIVDADQSAFELIGFLLQRAVLPPRLAAAAYQAAARIPGVRIVPNAVDAAGRRGIGVSRTSAAMAEPDPGGADMVFRMGWIFHPRTYVLLGETSESRLGTASVAIVKLGVVDRVREVPS